MVRHAGYYLHCVELESEPLYPAGGARRRSSPENQLYPAGTYVMWISWTMFHSIQRFGGYNLVDTASIYL